MSTVARNWREIPQRYRMEAGKCTSCGKVWFPPRRICSDCKGREFTNVVLPDEGEVETYTVIRWRRPASGTSRRSRWPS